jgi:hypothetical protein
MNPMPEPGLTPEQALQARLAMEYAATQNYDPRLYAPGDEFVAALEWLRRVAAPNREEGDG